MSIFGHMTAAQKGGPPSDPAHPASPRSGDGDATEEEEEEQDAGMEDPTGSMMQDLEQRMSDLSSSIKETITRNASDVSVKEEDPPHFTIDTSPTRHLKS